ncbi:MAG: GNAT family N-acetyltransferase [Desulfobacteraceae bacterium]|nr:GNAT family N-acetyltransferase [Desulfobacteraceae bacterium]
MKTVRLSTPDDYLDWLKLAKEVEPSFGPMVDDPIFCDGLRKAILEENAFCVTEGGGEDQRSDLFHGGIVISKEANEIVWFAVAQQSRGQGMGSALLSEAISRLDHTRPITVTTFDETVETGRPARGLYQSFGFHDAGAAGPNPAGIPTVVMTLILQKFRPWHAS